MVSWSGSRTSRVWSSGPQEKVPLDDRPRAWPLRGAYALGHRLLDPETCRCRDYANREANVSDCVQLTPGKATRLRWLPRTCAYRLVAEGRDLAWWHPLVSGDPETVHLAAVSVRSRAIPEERGDDLEDRIVDWPT